MNDLSPQILSTRPARGLANWRGLWTLYHKEVRRFLKIFGQTLLAPVVTTLLFLTVFAVAFGGGRMVAGMPYVQFLTPGLIMMAILQNAFTNTSTSLIQMKLNENIVDTLMPPLSPFELATAFIFSGATRGVMVALGVGVALSIVEPFDIHSAGLILFYGLGAAVMMSTIGLITGIWAEKFDHISTVTNFIILPLSFMSGTFFSIERFTPILQSISHANPFFYMIDGFRYGFTGHADGSVEIGIIVVTSINFVLVTICYLLLKSGYKLKE